MGAPKPVRAIKEHIADPARALGHSIFTEGEDLNELRSNVRDAVRCHFEDKDMPRVIRLHIVKDEVIAG
jgi:hypothetical protein